MDKILGYIRRAFAFIKKIIREVIVGLINFFEHVLNWFKSLMLVQEKHVPFLANANQLKEMLGTAPKKNVGIFKGVYDLQADDITYNEYNDADGIDSKTRQVLGNEPIVVLT